MKNILLLMVIVVYGICLLPAQIAPPEFQMKLHVRDAMGNRDSITQGYDRTETTQRLRPEWGEVAYNAPWDSVLDMRAREWDYSKVSIGSWEGDCILTVAGSLHVFVVMAKYPPLTFSWDKSLYNAPSPNFICRQQSYITNNNIIFMVPTPTQAPHTLLVSNDSVTYPNPYSLYYSGDSIPVTIQGGKQRMAAKHYLVFCNVIQDWVGIVSAEVLESQISVFPNPTVGNFSVSVGKIDAPTIEMELLQSDGKVLFQRSISRYEQGETLSFSPNLAAGLYFIRFSAEGYSAVKKLAVE